LLQEAEAEKAVVLHPYVGAVRIVTLGQQAVTRLEQVAVVEHSRVVVAAALLGQELLQAEALVRWEMVGKVVIGQLRLAVAVAVAITAAAVAEMTAAALVQTAAAAAVAGPRWYQQGEGA
jgi:esterase/lipase superfamily enzyme